MRIDPRTKEVTLTEIEYHELINPKPEVDLEKEVDKWRRDKNFDKSQDVKYSGENITRKSQIDIARHFYDLGRRASDITSDITSDINARKEDTK